MDWSIKGQVTPKIPCFRWKHWKQILRNKKSLDGAVPDEIDVVEMIVGANDLKWKTPGVRKMQDDILMHGNYNLTESMRSEISKLEAQNESLIHKNYRYEKQSEEARPRTSEKGIQVDVNESNDSLSLPAEWYHMNSTQPRHTHLANTLASGQIFRTSLSTIISKQSRIFAWYSCDDWWLSYLLILYSTVFYTVRFSIPFGLYCTVFQALWRLQEFKEHCQGLSSVRVLLRSNSSGLELSSKPRFSPRNTFLNGLQTSQVRVEFTSEASKQITPLRRQQLFSSFEWSDCRSFSRMVEFPARLSAPAELFWSTWTFLSMTIIEFAISYRFYTARSAFRSITKSVRIFGAGPQKLLN